MKNGTDSQKPSFEQLGQLAGFIVDFLAKLLSFNQVIYWLDHKSELKNTLRGLFVSESTKNFLGNLSFVCKRVIDDNAELELKNFFVNNLASGKIEGNMPFIEDIIPKMWSHATNISMSFSLYEVVRDINPDEILENFSLNGSTLYIKDIDALSIIARLLKKQINGEDGILFTDGRANVIGCSLRYDGLDSLIHYSVRWIKEDSRWDVFTSFDGLPGGCKITLYYRDL